MANWPALDSAVGTMCDAVGLSLQGPHSLGSSLTSGLSTEWASTCLAVVTCPE